MPDWINSIKLVTSPFSSLQTWGRMAEPELRLRGSSRSQRQPLPVSDQQNQHPTDECVHILNHWYITTWYQGYWYITGTASTGWYISRVNTIVVVYLTQQFYPWVPLSSSL